MRAAIQCLVGVTVGLLLCASACLGSRSPTSILGVAFAKAAVGGDIELCLEGRPVAASAPCGGTIDPIPERACPWFFGTCDEYLCSYDCTQIVVQHAGPITHEKCIEQRDNCEDVPWESCVQGFVICVCTYKPPLAGPCTTYYGADLDPYCGE